MQKFIITGGLGFIGSNLIKILLEKNYYVINIDKVTYASNFYNVRNFIKNKNYRFIKCDIKNQKKIFSILNKYKPKGIFNLAAETHVDRSIDGPKIFVENNINGTFSILEATRKYSKKNRNFRLLHVSTDEVYGDILKSRSKEKDAYKPSSPYAASKASSDHLVNSYIRTYKINAVITNCSNNYGPNQHPEKLIPKLIYNILNNKNLPIYGKGKNSREWIHVEDHSNALLKVFLKGKTGEFYNIGSNTNYNNFNIAQKLLKIAKKKITLGKKVKIKFVKDRPGHDMRYAINSDKIKRKLKWKPKINLDIGLLNTFEWYMKHKKFYSYISKKQIIKRLGTLND
tara:strand:- start:58 stop:1083 length:1026 start_codon:yes stop_codon:yes gene_type:complete